MCCKKAIADDDMKIQSIDLIQVVNNCVIPYRPDEADVVTPIDKYPRFELLQFPLVFKKNSVSGTICNSVEASIQFVF